MAVEVLTVTKLMQRTQGLFLCSLPRVFTCCCTDSVSIQTIGETLPKSRVRVLHRGDARSARCSSRWPGLGLRLHWNRSFPKRKFEGGIVRGSFASSSGFEAPAGCGAARLRTARPRALLLARPLQPAVRSPGPGAPALSVGGAQIQRRGGNRPVVTVHGHDPRHQPVVKRSGFEVEVSGVRGWRDAQWQLWDQSIHSGTAVRNSLLHETKRSNHHSVSSPVAAGFTSTDSPGFGFIFEEEPMAVWCRMRVSSCRAPMVTSAGRDLQLRSSLRRFDCKTKQSHRGSLINAEWGRKRESTDLSSS